MTTGLGEHRLQRVLDHIEANLEQPLLLKDLAGSVFLSPFHFARMFKDSTGHPPHAYVRSRRIAHACKLLTETDLPILQVARRCGFRTQSHFTGVFRQATGLTPNRYRGTRRVQAAPQSVTLSHDPA
jgi:AraC family transcriptional regulator